MFYVEEETIANYVVEEKEFTLYIARSECGDCQTVNETMLKDWSETTVSVDNPLYILDIQKYHPGSEPRKLDTETEEEFEERHAAWEIRNEIYVGVKNQYGLTVTSNPDFGYSTGMVPTFQHRIGNQIKDMIVLLNDSLSQNRKLISYFTTERVEKMNFLEGTGDKYVLDGMDITNDQIEQFTYQGRTYEMLKKEAHVALHAPIFKLFFDKYVK